MLTVAKIDPDTRPSSIGPPFTGHFRITADTPRGLQPLQPAPNSSITEGRPHASTDRIANSGKADLRFQVRRNVYDDKGKDVTPTRGDGSDANGEAGKNLEDSLEQDGKQHFCYECGKDCSRVRYHNSKNPPASAATAKPSKDQRYDICSMCFQEGRYPGSTSSADYIKLENNQYRSIADRESPWSDAELLLLLEGLEMFDDNWDSVSDHVGSRTREECVLKFLQLEIEDKYLDDAPAQPSGTGMQELSYLSGGRVPFSQFDNPVMSVMGFLAGLADPATTARAAGKSVEEMRRTLKSHIDREATAGASSSDKDVTAAQGNSTIKPETSTSVDMEDNNNNTNNTSLAVRDSEQQHHSSESNDLPTTALSLTAARAAALTSNTERALTAQVSAAVNLQLTKLELKLKQFGEMEALLQAERRELERSRQKLFLDRLAFRRRVREMEEKLGKMDLSGVEGGSQRMEMEGLGGGGGEEEVMMMGRAADVEPYQEGMEGFMRLDV